MPVLKWTLIWLLIFAAVFGGLLWYGMSQVVDTEFRGVPMP